VGRGVVSLMYIFAKSLFDGFMTSCGLWLLNSFFISTYSASLSAGVFLLICAILAVLTAVPTFFLLWKESESVRIKVMISSCLWFVLFQILFLVIPVRVFPIGETNAADGLVALLFGGIYLLVCALLKLSIFLVDRKQ